MAMLDRNPGLVRLNAALVEQGVERPLDLCLACQLVSHLIDAGQTADIRDGAKGRLEQCLSDKHAEAAVYLGMSELLRSVPSEGACADVLIEFDVAKNHRQIDSSLRDSADYRGECFIAWAEEYEALADKALRLADLQFDSFRVERQTVLCGLLTRGEIELVPVDHAESEIPPTAADRRLVDTADAQLVEMVAAMRLNPPDPDDLLRDMLAATEKLTKTYQQVQDARAKGAATRLALERRIQESGLGPPTLGEYLDLMRSL